MINEGLSPVAVPDASSNRICRHEKCFVPSWCFTWRIQKIAVWDVPGADGYEARGVLLPPLWSWRPCSCSRLSVCMSQKVVFIYTWRKLGHVFVTDITTVSPKAVFLVNTEDWEASTQNSLKLVGPTSGGWWDVGLKLWGEHQEKDRWGRDPLDLSLTLKVWTVKNILLLPLLIQLQVKSFIN